MKKAVTIIAAILCFQCANAQTWFTKTGHISFYSHTAIEDIKADNYEVLSFINAGTGEMSFQVLIKGFQFPKAAMQGHFNSAAYMDSDKFPQASFKGTISNIKSINLKKDGTYNITVQGDLTMHGVTKKITETGTITVKNGVVTSNAKFVVTRSDFKITTPSFTAAKIANDIEVTVICSYQLYKTE
jgi:polyisoprenoid-binding protein YceI